MQTTKDAEAVGENFDLNKLLEAQQKTWDLLQALAKKIEPGMSEADAVAIYQQMQIAAGAEKYWHPPKIRFGKNTLCAFREPSDAEVRLKQNDIFFIDIGPIFNGHEGDCGQTFVIGEYPAGEKIRSASHETFQKVRAKFECEKVSGPELYRYAEKLAADAGCELVGDGAKGHRVSEFPHAVHYRGNLREWEEARNPAPNRWILEIQLRDRLNQIGAFYEDLLGGSKDL